MKIVAVIVALLVAPGLAMAQDSTKAENRRQLTPAEIKSSARQLANDLLASFDRFELWNACKPVRLFVYPTGSEEDLSDNASKIGLTEERIETLVRSRLRAARIYDADVYSPYLYVNVNVFNITFSINLEFKKLVIDTVSREQGTAKTWGIRSTGTHGRDAGFILQAVSEHTDEFIDEYLRVNAKSCS